MCLPEVGEMQGINAKKPVLCYRAFFFHFLYLSETGTADISVFSTASR
jgi:hypothetical protein